MNKLSTNATVAKRADAKGRITLGGSFANKTMLIERRGDEIVLRAARVVPEREAWLHENKAALASVLRGLEQAKERAFAKKDPDLRAAKALAENLGDD